MHSLRLLLCTVLLMALGLHAEDAAMLPVLRVAADMHTAAVNGIAVDASGRLVLTVSDDKTARLWAVDAGTAAAPTARLLRVLRPWMGDGPEGKLLACALNPAGTLAAVSGATGETGKPDTTRIYLWDTATGALVRQIDGLQDQVLSLAFSDSGRYLAAGLDGEMAGNSDVRVFDPVKGVELAREDGGRFGCISVDWHGDSDLLTAWGEDKLLRLYHREGDLLAGLPGTGRTHTLTPTARGSMSDISQGEGGSTFSPKPSIARFSPDGSKVAVSSDRTLAVEVLEGSTLKPLYQPVGEWINNGGGGHFGVAWSSDGSLLAHGMYPISIWQQGGRGAVQRAEVCEFMISDVCSLPAAVPPGFLYAADDASWGLVQPTGKDAPKHFKLGPSPVLGFSIGQEGFGPEGLKISDDATEVAFPLDREGKRYGIFSVTGRVLSQCDGTALPDRLHGPRFVLAKAAKDDSSEIASDLFYDLSGNLLMAIVTGPGEVPRSRCIAADGSFFILGTDQGLHRFDRKGGQLWGLALPMPVVAVNLSADGRLVVVACGDGTLHWHRTSDGRELLALLPDRDAKRWVTWAPLTAMKGSPVFDLERFRQDVIDGFIRIGLQPGRDIITSVNDTPVQSQTPGGKDAAFNQALATVLPRAVSGQTITIGLRQAGRARTLEILLHGSSIPCVTATYFDTSPGADDMIGWHLNRSREQAADFLPAARFSSVYYRPDIVARMLKTLDVDKAISEANAALGKPSSQASETVEVIARLSPPVVDLETGGTFREVVLPTEATTIKLRYRVRQTGKEPATTVQVKLNARPLDVTAKVPDGNEAAEVDVPLPDGLEGELAVIASHKLASSEPAIIRVRRSARPVDARKPNLYIIAAGVSKLQANIGLDTDGDGAVSDAEFLKKFTKNGLMLDDLNGADVDARRVGDLFHAEEGRTYAKVTTQVLVNEQATTAALRSALEQVTTQALSGDVVVFSFAGHGYADEKHEFFLATHDVHPDRPGESALTGKALVELLSPVKARVVLLLDTCQSGAVLGRKEGAKVITGPEDLTGLVNTLSSTEHGIVVLSSSSESEPSFESDGGGLFTRAFSEGINGKAALDGAVTCVSVQDYITKRVSELLNENSAIKSQGLTQTPTVIIPKGAPDFILARP